MTALEKCSRAGYNSIAFPAIGMGTKGYSSTSVAETMIRAITEYFVSHPKTSIKRVVLYLHPGDAKSVSVNQLKVRSCGISYSEAYSNFIDLMCSNPCPKINISWEVLNGD